MPPYLPFLEALGTYVRASQAEVLLHQLGTTPRLLAGLLPEIELKLKRLPMGPQLAPEQARLRLFDAVADFLRAIADARPAVLLLDDLQWAGTAILDLLVHVARRSRSSRADPRRLSARRRCSQRGGPADAGRTRPPAIARRNAGYSTLSESETRDLGEGFRRASVHDNLAAALWRHSEGNPFVAEELLRGWLDAGQVRNNAGVWALSTQAPIALPKGIRAAVAQRVARLDSSIFDTLRVATVLGRAFDLRLLARVLDDDAERVEERVLRAAERALIESVAPGTFRFAQDTIREILYARLPSKMRQRLYEAAGLALERAMERSVSRHWLSWHFNSRALPTAGVRSSTRGRPAIVRWTTTRSATRSTSTSSRPTLPTQATRNVVRSSYGSAVRRC